MYNSTIGIEKKGKEHEVLISKVLINSYMNHEEFVSVNNVLKEYRKMKKK